MKIVGPWEYCSEPGKLFLPFHYRKFLNNDCAKVWRSSFVENTWYNNVSTTIHSSKEESTITVDNILKARGFRFLNKEDFEKLNILV